MTPDHIAGVDWAARAARQQMPGGLVIDGGSRSAGSTRSVVTPRDGSGLGHLPWADAAVVSARRALDSGPWPRLHPRERGDLLLRFADVVEAHRDELALLVALEMGEPIRVAHEVELRALVRTLRLYGEAADKEHGEVTPTDGGARSLVTRDPAGVVAAVVPWSFPLTLAGWEFAPALAAGCAVVLKTAEQSPLSMLRIAELGLEAGLPPGVLNVVTGDGAEVGRRLGEHPDVDVLTFTRSPAVGRHFLRYCPASNLERVHPELGGKSPNTIFPDAPHLDAAAAPAAWAIFFDSGEMCPAGSRLVLHRDIADEVVGKVVSGAAEWASGDPVDPATRMRPLVDERSPTRVLSQLEDGVGSGAEVLAGGHRIDDDDEEALRVARDTPYVLTAVPWTSDLGTAHRVSRRLRAGTVGVNCDEEGDLSVPFGGVRLSGFGRGTSRHALGEYSDLNTTWISYA